MTKRIFFSIFAVVLIVLAASVGSILTVLYGYFSNQYNSQLRLEAVYLARGVDLSGMEYLSGLARTDRRITWIDSEGTVLFDNIADGSKMENHGEREEVKQALRLGAGESVRYSSTLSEKTVNYALRLSDGSVLRISGASNSVWALLLSVSQFIVMIGVIAVIISALLAYRMAKQIVKPLNAIDFEGLEQTKMEIYPELSPFFQRIEQQNRRIHEQMEELKRQQREFSAITENMAEGFLVVDHQTNVLSYNASALKLLGVQDRTHEHDMKNVEKQSVLTLNRSESFRRAVDLALSGVHNEQNMFFEERSYQIIANPVLEERKTVGAILVIWDITEREEREYLRREFSANVSHELKTPLTSISGYAEIIQGGLVKAADVPRFAGRIYDEAQRLMRLINDIMKLSQLDENSVVKEKEPVDLKEISESVVQSLENYAAGKSVELSIDCLTEESYMVYGVPQILEEMIYNLCDNAVKYNRPNGSVTVSLKKLRDNGVELSVKDTGIGIPFADRDRVFERFYRVNKSHSKEVGGTGLGLSIVKHGALFHQASVHLDSVEKEGATVTIQFPAPVLQP